ncbi:DeoR/GlpR family DNA-binding transcription regulator [Actibacterium sp. 188UL27-1]|uniref:DeoR/GlpR family DNA-binding transcription regulator n=1 Tax=Actibacterium sp. 188UL27-1 TaxID=2786961 RepID=UPI00195998AB|nr:DeoR/GlpR family DNA-binding transcription regulator [Actibacterium sp. 188UL27-1]MBM7068919.1 DeoR/GlpR transcriptional regulator [Actibacterium sp. 188UL27-1]
MTESLRVPEILALARRDGGVRVEDLVARFQVTPQTIRRDLTALERAGKLERVHGGAVMPSATRNIAYQERRALNAAAKTRIGEACAALIPDDSSLFLNIGTTTEAVAGALLHHRNLMVVTNNLNVAMILAANPEAQVIVTGGKARGADGGLVGALAIDCIERFKLDHAVIGCSAIDTGGDLLDFDPEEVAVSKTILDRSRTRILVADQTKLSRPAPIRIGTLEQIDRIVTDAPLPARLGFDCGRWRTTVEIAGPETSG